MSGPAFDYLKAAAFIVDSMVFGLARTCEMHGISSATGKRWKKRYETDQRLIVAVGKIKTNTLKPVESTSKKAAEAILSWLEDLPKHLADPTPSLIDSMTEAYRTIEEIRLARDMIDAKLSSMPKSINEGRQSQDLAKVEPVAIDV
jgi:hypothetical protein